MITIPAWLLGAEAGVLLAAMLLLLAVVLISASVVRTLLDGDYALTPPKPPPGVRTTADPALAAEFPPAVSAAHTLSDRRAG